MIVIIALQQRDYDVVIYYALVIFIWIALLSSPKGAEGCKKWIYEKHGSMKPRGLLRGFLN
jgi:hypothetical protein